MAGEFLPPVLLRFVGDTRGLISSFGQAESKTAAFGKTVTKMGALSTAAVVGIGVEAVRMATKFEASTERIHTQAGVAQSAIGGIRKGLLDMAGQVGQTPEHLSEAFYHFASTGMTVAQSMKATYAAANLAAIGNMNLADAANALAGAQKSGITGFKDFNDLVAVMNTTVGAGNMQMSDLVSGIATGVLPTFKSAGMTIEDYGGALALATDNSMNAQVATHLLMTTVGHLETPSGAAAKALAAMHFSTHELADDMRSGGLVKLIGDLHTHLDKLGDSTKAKDTISSFLAAIGGGPRGDAMLKLLYSEYGGLQQKMDAFGNASSRAKTYGDALAQTHKTLAWQEQDLKAKFDAVMTELGMKLIPMVDKAIGFFARHKAMTADLAAALGSLMALSIVAWFGKLAWSVGQAGFAFGKALFAVARFGVTTGVTLVQQTGAALLAVGRFGVSVGVTLVRQVGLALVAVGRFIVELVVDTVAAAGKATLALGRLALALGRSLVSAAVAAGRAIIGFTATLVTNPIFLVAAAIAALVAGIVLLWMHWNQVWNWIQHHKAYAAAIAAVMPVIATMVAITGAVHYLWTHWHQVWSDIASFTHQVGADIAGVFSGIAGGVDWVIGKLSSLEHVASGVGHVISAGAHFLGLASGGVPPVGQPVLVGERGPELVTFGAPAYVHPAGDTARILASARAAGGWVGGGSGGYAAAGGYNNTSGGGDLYTTIVIKLDEREVYRGMQRQALQAERRNISNGLSRLR